MADEFAKGLGILTGAGLAWMVLAGWFNTPSFEGEQFTAANPENVDVYVSAALVLKEALFWFAILGALFFWVVLPAFHVGRRTWAERRAAE